MTRDVSLGFKEAVYDQETGEVFVFLITLEHPDLNPPIRVCSDSEDISSNGEVFISYPFKLVWIPDKKGRPPVAKLQIDNVDRQIIDTLRQLPSRVTITVQLISTARPDVIEATLPEFELAEVDYDAFAIQGNLSLEYFVNEPYPQQTFTQATHPGLF